MLKHQYLLDKLSLYFDLLILPHTHDALTHTHLCDIILAGWMVMGGWLCWVGGCGPGCLWVVRCELRWTATLSLTIDLSAGALAG